MKKLLASTVVLLSLGFSANAEPIPEYPQLYAGPTNAPNGTISYTSIIGGTNGYRSSLSGHNVENGKVTKVFTCKSMQDTECAKANVIIYKSVLGMCSGTTSTDCISSFNAIDSNGNTFPGKLLPSVFSEKDGSFEGSRQQNIPSGGQSPLVNIPGAPHAFGTTYLPVVIVTGGGDNRNFYPLQDLVVRLYAVKVVQGQFNFTPSTMDLNASDYNNPFAVNWYGSDTRCVENDSTNCIVPTELPINFRFSITFKTSIPIPGWMHGQVVDPSIQIASTGSDYLTTIAAKPILNPMISVTVPIENLSADFLRPYQYLQFASQTNCDKSSFPMDLSTCQYTEVINDYGQRDFDEFLKWLSYAKDTAFINPARWDVVLDPKYKNIGNCAIPENQVGGMVSTNAPMYLAGPPAWNPNNLTLDYKVAAPHYLSDKSINQGSYDLAINSKLARCLYKFTNAPISASLTIQSIEGKNQIATTVVRESNGFLYLSAKGFTFSSPVLSVKLFGEPIPEPVVQPTPTPSPTESTQPVVTLTSQPTPKVVVTKKPVIVKSVTCINGKNSKVFKGSTCPKGWKPK